MRDILKRALPEADDIALDRFEIYHRLLGEWNEKMNLTAITDPAAVAQKHFADSLAALPYLKPGPTSSWLEMQSSNQKIQ